MSMYETPEQRRMRELQNRINVLENQSRKKEKENKKLQEAMNIARREAELENKRLELKMAEEMRESANRERNITNARIRAIDEQNRERERLLNNKISEMKKNHDQKIQKMETLFKEENQNLKKEIGKTRSEMHQGFTRIRQETDRKLQKQSAEYQQKLDSLSVSVNKKISQVNERIDDLMTSLSEKEKNDRAMAEYWVESAEKYLNNLKKGFKPQLFEERKVRELEQAVENARQDLQNGFYGNVILLSRDSCAKAMDMKQDLAAKELEWNYRFNALSTRKTELLSALENAEKHESYVFTDEDGERVEADGDLDYWTYGKFSELSREIEYGMDQLRNVEGMSSEQLTEAEETLLDQQSRLNALLGNARSNVAMALTRLDTAAMIAEALDENYMMDDVEGAYFDEEERNAYHASFYNPRSGKKAVITITPDVKEDGSVENIIDVHTMDETYSEGDDEIKNVQLQHNVQKVVAQVCEQEDCSFPCSNRNHEQMVSEIKKLGNIEQVRRGNPEVKVKVPQQREQTVSQTAAQQHVQRRH